MPEKDTPLTEAVYYILLSLRHPNHGYGIIQEVEHLTNGRVLLGAGTLYGAIQTLLKKNWIKLYSMDIESRKKKEYVITEQGRNVFAAETARLRELLENAALMDKADF
ncbi:MAG: PadR family transcriptional regulator [Muribaculaceae bacterium]|nr:PadR family transcriptional regulator [Muribaculaceae bacterium]